MGPHRTDVRHRLHEVRERRRPGGLMPRLSEDADVQSVCVRAANVSFPTGRSPQHIEPEVRAVAEHAGENESGRRGYIAAIVAELIDVLALHAHRVSQRALRLADRLHEFFDQNFADRRRLAFVINMACFTCSCDRPDIYPFRPANDRVREERHGAILQNRR